MHNAIENRFLSLKIGWKYSRLCSLGANGREVSKPARSCRARHASFTARWALLSFGDFVKFIACNADLRLKLPGGVSIKDGASPCSIG